MNFIGYVMFADFLDTTYKLYVCNSEELKKEIYWKFDDSYVGKVLGSYFYGIIEANVFLNYI